LGFAHSICGLFSKPFVSPYFRSNGWIIYALTTTLILILELIVQSGFLYEIRRYAKNTVRSFLSPTACTSLKIFESCVVLKRNKLNTKHIIYATRVFRQNIPYHKDTRGLKISLLIASKPHLKYRSLSRLQNKMTTLGFKKYSALLKYVSIDIQLSKLN